MVLPSLSVIRWLARVAASMKLTCSRYCALGPLGCGAALPAAKSRATETTLRPIAAAAAEQAFEDIAEVDPFGTAAEAAHALAGAEPALAGAKPARAAAAPAEAERHRRIPVDIDLAAIESGALVLVGQQVIGLGHLGETLGRLGVPRIAIGVQFLGELAIGALDVLLGRAARNAQDRVGIGHGCVARVRRALRQAPALSYLAGFG